MSYFKEESYMMPLTLDFHTLLSTFTDRDTIGGYIVPEQDTFKAWLIGIGSRSTCYAHILYLICINRSYFNVTSPCH